MTCSNSWVLCLIHIYRTEHIRPKYRCAPYLGPDLHLPNKKMALCTTKPEFLTFSKKTLVEFGNSLLLTGTAEKAFLPGPKYELFWFIEFKNF